MLYLHTMGLPVITWNEIFIILAVAVQFGMLWAKLNYIQEYMQTAGIDAKELRIRIEKVELSIIELSHEIDKMKNDESYKYQRNNIS